MGSVAMSYAATVDTSTWGSVGRRFWLSTGSQLTRGIDVIRRAAMPGAALGIASPGAIMSSMQRGRELLDAYRSVMEMAVEMAAADEADPPSPETWGFAFLALLSFSAKLPLPLLSPLQLGGLSAEWHERGMNIELRFRGVDDVFAVIEDATGEIPEFQGRDPTLARTAAALGRLADRAP